MASYQIRHRDPLIHAQTQARLARRGRELLGVGLLGLALAVALMLGSYRPDDSSWLAATDAPAANLLGRTGASIAAPMMIVLGRGAWLLVPLFAAWGLRFVLHRGAERALARLIFAPIALALAAVFASTLLPGPDWPHSFGLGGLFGDTVLGALLGVAPVSASFGLKVVSLLLVAGLVGLSGYAMGLDRGEVRLALRWSLFGLVALYAGLLALLRWLGLRALRGAAAGLAAWRAYRDVRAARAGARAPAAPPTSYSGRGTLRAVRAAEGPAEPPRPLSNRAEPPVVRAAAPAARPRAEPPADGLHSRDDARAAVAAATRLPNIARRADMPDDAAPHEPPPARPGRQPPAPPPVHPRLSEPEVAPFAAVESDPEPELVETEPPETPLPPRDGAEARVRAKIADLIRSRATRAVRLRPVAAAGGPAPALRPEPPLLRARRPPPLIAGPPRPPAEPPVPPAAPAPSPVAAVAALARSVFGGGSAEPPVVLPGSGAGVWPGEGPAGDGRPSPGRTAEAVPARPAMQPQPAAAPPPAGPEAPRGEDWPDVSGAVQPAPACDPRRVVQHPPRRPAAPSRQALAEAQPRLRLEEAAPVYEPPPLQLLANPAGARRHTPSDEALAVNARMLESVLDDYGVKGEIVSVRPGPVVTLYELEPAPGLKASRVIGLADDIARSMSALSARVSTVPGRSVIGIELPNAHREDVLLREILASRDFGDSQMRLPLALGKDIAGTPVVANLAKMPHLLIAGTTGSGKSVAINTMILSLLYKLSPEDCRLIMIDPKMLELSVYDGIPHLLSPVVTDPKKAVVALKWVVGEMEERYRKMSKMGVRNIEGYNGRVREALARGEMFRRTIQTGFDDETGDPVFETEEFAPVAIPYIVVVVDEMADLMMVAGKEIEACIQRLAQMARASGIHLIMATQRPSVDVITGTIKANFPTRISFQVTSKIDSRTILGEMGAEQLLGKGDMLYMAGGAKIMRIHGPFVSDEEVEEIVNHLKSYGPPAYVAGVIEGPEDEREGDIDAVLGLGGGAESDDALYDQAVAIVARDRKCSTSYIQRKLGIGYNKAARLVEQMEDRGVVTPANHVGKREILVPEP